MKEVKAYIREYMLDAVLDNLNTIPGLPGIAVVHLHEYGHAVGERRLLRADMVKLELDIPDDLVEIAVDAIRTQARTGDGHPGDGKIFVSKLDEAIRIADGARGDGAVRR